MIGARITYVVLGQSDRTKPAPDEFSARFIRSVSVLSGSGLTQSLEARLRIELGRQSISIAYPGNVWVHVHLD